MSLCRSSVTLPAGSSFLKHACFHCSIVVHVVVRSSVDCRSIDRTDGMSIALDSIGGSPWRPTGESSQAREARETGGGFPLGCGSPDFIGGDTRLLETGMSREALSRRKTRGIWSDARAVCPVCIRR